MHVPGTLMVIIPAFNEAGRVKQTLDKVDRFLSSTKRTYEIVVVDETLTAPPAGQESEWQFPVAR